jgi:hypothetical protein
LAAALRLSGPWKQFDRPTMTVQSASLAHTRSACGTLAQTVSARSQRAIDWASPTV